MTTLIVKTLETEIVQPFTLTNRRYQVAGVKSYLYVHNYPDGDFTFTILKDSVPLISKTFNINEVYDSLPSMDEFMHLFYPVNFDNGLCILSDGEYELKLTASGYTFSDNSYLGWVKEYESIYVPFSENISTQDDYPCSFRLLDYQKRELI
jgi:hypothetical protein